MTYNTNKLLFITDQQKSSVDVCYKGESLSFNMFYFKKGKNNKDVAAAVSPFTEFNHWIGTHDEKWMDSVFDIYRKIKEAINEINHVEMLLVRLNSLFIDLYSHVDLHEIKEWIKSPNSPIKIVTKSNTGYGRGTTYDYEDYLELCTFSLALRFAAPAWGDISKRLAEEYGNEVKETYAMEILHGTCMMSNQHTGEVCRAEERFREFITNTKAELDPKAILVAGLSEEDFYNYLYSIIILKKIACGEFVGRDGGYNLIIQAWFAINQKIDTASKKYGNDNSLIHERKVGSFEKIGDDANSQSIMDMSFSRSRLSIDDREFMRININDHPYMIQQLEPNLPEDIYEESMSTIHQMDMNYSHLSASRKDMVPVQEVQLTIAKWVLNEAVDTIIFDYLDLKDTYRMLGLVRAILWYRGFYEFAALCSAVALPIDTDNIVLTTNKRKNLSQAEQERLSRVFMYSGVTKSEKRNMSPSGCIEIIDHAASQVNWLLTLPEKWLQQNYLVHKDKMLILPPEFRSRVGELMIHIESRQEPIQSDRIIDDF